MRSLANLKREISEKKWVEARQWAGSRTSKKKYRLPKSQRPDGTVAGSTRRLASRFYQLKTGHCLTGQCLNWTKNRPTPQCWWYWYRTQTRDHLFKECPEWKPQQKILWAEVKKETERWKDRWKVRDLLVLNFLSSTDVGRRVPAEAEDDAVSAVSELEVREWLVEQGAGTEEPALGGNRRISCPHPTSWRPQERCRRCSFIRLLLGSTRSLFSFVPFFCNLLGAHHTFSGQAWAEGKRGACNELPLRGKDIKSTWDTTRRHAMQSVLQLPEYYVLVTSVGGGSRFQGSRFSPAHKLQPDGCGLWGWPWTDLCPAGRG